MEETACSEWSDGMDIVGSNHWLPAYGFQQPTQLQQALLQHQDSNDGATVLIPGQQQQQFLILETIVEETSDDLRSESDRSGPAGWADSDSDTESVIHVPNNLDACDVHEWSGSERDLAVPKKRRRRTTDQEDTDDDQDGSKDPDTASLSSRSSSLLQFECLEKHCEDIFRTSATSDPFHDSSPFAPPSPSVMSNFSFDSLESNRWRFSASPDSLDEENSDSDSAAMSSDECASSDDTLQHSHSSWSSRSSFRSSNSRLRSFRSFDSLNLLQPPQHHNSFAEMSQSLTSNSFLLHMHPATTADLPTPVATVATRSPQLVTKNGSVPEVASVMSSETGCSGSGKEPAVEKKPQRSAENLSEDSGFGDHCVTSPSASARGGTVGTIVEDEDLYSYYSDSSAGSSGGGVASSETSEQEKTAPTATKKVLKLNAEFDGGEGRGWGVEESKFNSSCWQSAPSLLLAEERKRRRALPVYREAQYRAQGLSSLPDILCLCLSEEKANCHQQRSDATGTADKHMNWHSMATRFPVSSTPNIMYSAQEEFIRNEQTHSSMVRVPLKSPCDSANEVDRYVNDDQGPKSLTPLASACKGVHFCPVVSEVSWRDSYSDDDAQEDRDDEEMDRALCALELGEDVTVPLKQTLLLQKIQIGVPVGPGSTERERVVMELQQDGGSPVTPTAGEGHVTTSTAAAAQNAAPVAVVSMETKQVKGGSSSRETSSESSRCDSELSTVSSNASSKRSGSKFGGFFQRFSLRRLSGRNSGASKKQKEDKKKVEVKGKSSDETQRGAVTGVEYEDVTIIPLHPPTEELERKPTPDAVVSSKPPLPPLPPRSVGNSSRTVPSPRRRPDAHDSATTASGLQQPQGKLDSAAMSRIDPAPLGLLETDLDTDISTVRPHQNGAAPSSKKARSLLNLGAAAMLLKPPPGGNTNRPHIPADSRAKSMEFLLDKENQAAVQPPENELQKGGAGDRVMSEHQLRVQRSLQKLNIPDWYKNSSVARGPEGFLLKRGSDSGGHGWPGLSSKTTSLSSLGSTQSAAARSPTGHLLSPSPSPHVFTRWSTSRLNSGGTSTSTSPCGSTRSSFNYRQPYLGWRSQERLTRPRTPAERLAAGLLPTQQQQQQQLGSPQGVITPRQTQQDLEQLLQQEAELEQLRREDEEQMQQVPNLSEVRTSIKEVTSAIVHYVSGVRDGSGEALAGDTHWESLSPPRGADWGNASTPRGTPRGSTGRLCWLESSFVGTRPLDSPETPHTLTSADVNKTLETLQQQQDGGVSVTRKLSGMAGPADLYLDLGNSQRHQNVNALHHHQTNGLDEQYIQQVEMRNKPSPGSTTLEDVLDSLLGLPPTSRSPSPGAGSASPGHCRPSHPPPPLPPQSHQHHSQRRSCGDLRSDLAGSASDGQPAAPEPPPYYVSDIVRRRSEGSTPRPSSGGRRVSFDMTTSCGGGQQQQHQQPQPDQSMVRCRYSKCGRTASVAEARRTFKTCHNCSHVYCSRECRRAHWERHRKTCLHSRVGALCHQVLTTAREDPATLHHLSLLARRGYLAQGRGAVKSFFSSPELAERFVANGFVNLGEPAFVRWADLLPSEMGVDLYSELLRLCKSYMPDTRFVLYVAVCVVSEVPTTGAVKWERQLVSRCAKLRLCRSVMPTAPPQTSGGPQKRTSPCNITRDSENPETLILTSLPGCQGQMAPHRAREISFTNIQRHLRQRGVSLRRHFPDVYKRLCAYVEGSTERFTPVTVYPRDALTGKSFMCIIMPDAEPEKLELLPRDSSRVQTIDISLEYEVT